MIIGIIQRLRDRVWDRRVRQSVDRVVEVPLVVAEGRI